MNQRTFENAKLSAKYFSLLTVKENLLQELINFSKLNSSYISNLSNKDNYLQNQIDNFNYIEAKLKKIIELLLESEKIEKEFVLQCTEKIFVFYLEELDTINSLEKERLKLLQNEKDKSIIKVIEKQGKVIAKETYYLIIAYILISEKLDNINKIIESNLVERKSLLIGFDEFKNRCAKIFNIYNIQEKLMPNNITNNLDYDGLKIEKVIQEFLITCQEKLKLVRKNSENINVGINELVKSVNNLIIDKLDNFDLQEPILSKKIARFLPSQIVKKENMMLLNNSGEIEIEELNKEQYKCINESFFISNCININSIIANIKLFIQDELKKNDSLELTVDYMISNDNKNQYQELKTLLKNKKWQEADQKTSKIFLEVMKKKSSVDIALEDLIHFPQDIFLQLDQLWLKYSDGKYGFSVQKKILDEYGETIDTYDNKVYKYFLKKIGRYKSKSLIDKIANIFNISPQNNKGYFPSIIVLNISKGWTYIYNLIDS